MLNIKSFFKKLKALHKKAYDKATYRITCVDTTEGDEYIVTIQVVGKRILFKQTPQTILADDSIVSQFTQKDIRTLTYLGYLNINKPRYTILAKKHSEKLNKMIFALHKRGEKGYDAKTADQIAISEEILNSLSPKEAYIVGYMAATEQAISEAEEKRNLKEKRNQALQQENKNNTST